MAQRGQVYQVRSISTVHFTGSAAQNAALAEGLPFPGAIGSSGKVRIVGISIVSVQNLDWDIYFFNNAFLGSEGSSPASPPLGTPLDLKGAAVGPPVNEGTPGTAISFAGAIKLAATTGFQIGGAGLWFYYSDYISSGIWSLDIPYYDEVAPVGPNSAAGPRLHTILVNRNAAQKNAGASGAVVLTIHVEPTNT